MNKVFIIEAKRTPVGTFLGSLKDQHPAHLGSLLVKDIMTNTKLPVESIDEVIVGNVLPAGLGQGVGRQVSILAGLPQSVTGYTLNMVCGSGLKSVLNGYAYISSGIQNLVFAGGVENMSMAPYLVSHKTRGGARLGDMKLVDHMIYDALTDVYASYHMGQTAENIVKKHNLTRQEQDEFAFKSQQKAIKAIDSKRFVEEIVPIEFMSKKGLVMFDTDEYPNRDSSIEKLAKLRPVWDREGSVTAGNASGINDGAAMTLLASEEMIKKYNLKPLVEIVAIGQSGADPSVMGLAPVDGVKNVLENAKMKLDDIGLLELNEAFAAQSIGVLKELSADLKVDYKKLLEKTNVNGGAIAIGHPVGASGTRILVTLIHEMIKSGTQYGLASLCIGGGMSTAIIVKNVKGSK